MKQKTKKNQKSEAMIKSNPFTPKNGWKNLRVCTKCGELVKEGTACSKCKTVWEGK